MTSSADAIIGLYRRYAREWTNDRGRRLFEKSWVDRFLGLQRPGSVILDVGCGSGEPIARYLIDNGYTVTGIDSSPELIEICRRTFPDVDWRIADMRTLALGRQFDGILAWDSFFHLSHDDQRDMFPIFAAHAAPKAALMFTSGPAHSEAIGEYRGEPLYHSSLDPGEYTALLTEHGFEVVEHVAEDPTCGHHTIWLAQRR
jgi:2-polyprenyl-3-methyl-5-hydroxy-6-metoxy-1,4-benzoquinol methylase